MVSKNKLIQRIKGIQADVGIVYEEVNKTMLIQLYDELLEATKKQVTKDQAQKLIKNSGGKFITVWFIKRDNSIRKLVGRLGVSKFVTGVGKRFNDDAKGIQTIWEACHPENRTSGYRSFKYDSLVKFQINGVRYEVQ